MESLEGSVWTASQFQYLRVFSVICWTAEVMLWAGTTLDGSQVGKGFGAQTFLQCQQAPFLPPEMLCTVSPFSFPELFSTLPKFSYSTKQKTICSEVMTGYTQPYTMLTLFQSHLLSSWSIFYLYNLNTYLKTLNYFCGYLLLLQITQESLRIFFSSQTTLTIVGKPTSF